VVWPFEIEVLHKGAAATLLMGAQSNCSGQGAVVMVVIG
jgi:hypothetical protein